jgi:hypothetical protein
MPAEFVLVLEELWSKGQIDHGASTMASTPVCRDLPCCSERKPSKDENPEGWNFHQVYNQSLASWNSAVSKTWEEELWNRYPSAIALWQTYHTLNQIYKQHQICDIRAWSGNQSMNWPYFHQLKFKEAIQGNSLHTFDSHYDYFTIAINWIPFYSKQKLVKWHSALKDWNR